MLRIDCPFCGERDHAEFTYGEDASINWPDFASSDRQAHFEALYLRENPRGRHLEKWQHIMGCRSWLLVERDTLTHQIYSVRPARDRLEKKPAKGRRSKISAQKSKTQKSTGQGRGAR